MDYLKELECLINIENEINEIIKGLILEQYKKYHGIYKGHIRFEFGKYFIDGRRVNLYVGNYLVAQVDAHGLDSSEHYDWWIYEKPIKCFGSPITYCSKERDISKLDAVIYDVIHIRNTPKHTNLLYLAREYYIDYGGKYDIYMDYSISQKDFDRVYISVGNRVLAVFDIALACNSPESSPWWLAKDDPYTLHHLKVSHHEAVAEIDKYIGEFLKKTGALDVEGGIMQ